MSENELAVLNHVFDTLASGLLIVRLDGRIVRINRRAREILALTSKDVNKVQDFPAHLSSLSALLLQGEENIPRAEMSLHFPQRAEPMILGYNLTRIQETAKDFLYVMTFSDITQVVQDRMALDRIQDELQQSKKLASLGTLVAGVAHELNNPLTGISMSISLVKMNLDRIKQQPAVKADKKLNDGLDKLLLEIQKIRRANEKAGVLVNDLLAYSKPAQLTLEPVSVAELMRDVVNALRTQPQFAQIQFSIKPMGSYRVLCDRVKLEQVFYNLFKNASDAMSGQGNIMLFLCETSIRQKPAIAVHVKDDGPGMDAATLNRIFDPFFTTKGHNGVGLGLSISYRTVEQHGGLLSVESSPGKGTDFAVTLPLYLEEAEMLQPESGG